MNVHQTIPRIDCKRFAKCEKKSLAHCRQHRGAAPDCAGCSLIRRKPKNTMTSNDGTELKKCTCCGRWLPLFRFYKRTAKVSGKEYHSLTSWCKQCKSNQVLINHRKSRNYEIRRSN